MISMPGNSASRLAAITSSSGTNVVLATISTKRGSTSLGTFTRANASCVELGSRSRTTRLSDRFEMYGNGRPGPTASGVSTGKISSRKQRSIVPARGSVSSSQPRMRMPCSASAGHDAVGELAGLAAILRADASRRSARASRWA